MKSSRTHLVVFINCLLLPNLVPLGLLGDEIVGVRVGRHDGNFGDCLFVDRLCSGRIFEESIEIETWIGVGSGGEIERVKCFVVGLLTTRSVGGAHRLSCRSPARGSGNARYITFGLETW